MLPICLICPIGLIPAKILQNLPYIFGTFKKICTFAAVIHTLCVIASIALNVPAVLKALTDLMDLRDLTALNDLKQTTILILKKIPLHPFREGGVGSL